MKVRQKLISALSVALPLAAVCTFYLTAPPNEALACDQITDCSGTNGQGQQVCISQGGTAVNACPEGQSATCKWNGTNSYWSACSS